MTDSLGTVLTTTSSFAKDNPEILSLLEHLGFLLVQNPYARKLSENELVHLISQHRPVALLAGTENIGRSSLELGKEHLEVISRVGVGWDNIDRQAAKELGIRVYRTEGVLDEAVAELTVGMILCALRAIAVHSSKLKNGVWNKKMGVLLENKTVGIIGFGRIGLRVGELIRAFRAKVVYSDPVKRDVPWAKKLTLDELLSVCDIITLHASGSDTILGEREIKTVCKKGAIIINTARGGLVDEGALHSGLLSGKISCACLDVFENEPYTGPLRTCENVVLTPHIGSYAREARIRMEEMAVDNLLQAFDLQKKATETNRNKISIASK